MKTAENVDAYIIKFPPQVQDILEKVRETVKKAAPAAVETISYGMPTYKLKKALVHFAAQQEHLGFYPTPSGVEHFKQELAGYATSKGTIRFPWDAPIPYDLIKRIVEFRVSELSP